MHDQELLARFQREQSDDAFAALVEKYRRLVFSTALRKLQNPVLAEEATQTVFIILARKASSLRHNVSIAGWLHNTAMNVARDMVRSEARRKIREQVAMNDVHKNEIPAQVEHLEDSISALGPRDRDVLLQRYFNNESIAQLAANAGLPESAIRKQLQRAIERLRNLLRKRGFFVVPVAIATLLETSLCAEDSKVSSHSLSSNALKSANLLRLADLSLRMVLIERLKRAAGLAALVVATGGVCVTTYVVNSSTASLVKTAPLVLTELRVENAMETAALPFTWDNIESSDYLTYMANLRAIGCPEVTIRDLVIADISRQYGTQMWALMRPFQSMERAHHAGDADVQTRNRQLDELKKQKAEAIKSVLGQQGVEDLAYFTENFWPALSYAWLPIEKRTLVTDITAKYEAQRQALFRIKDIFSAPEDEEVSKSIKDRELNEIQEVLSPEEVKEFQIRKYINERIDQHFKPTREEMFAIHDAKMEMAKWPYFAGETPEARVHRLQKIEESNQKLREVLGGARFEEYEKAQNPFYRDAKGFSERFGFSVAVRDEIFSSLTSLKEEASRLGRTSSEFALYKAQVKTRLQEILGPRYETLEKGGRSDMGYYLR